MKYCHNCKNKDWKPTEGFNKPLIHKGKVNHRNMSIRYYYCANCGARLKTIERFHEYVTEQNLFDEVKNVRDDNG